jgi:choline dehydrogenase-like flavoprotein
MREATVAIIGSGIAAASLADRLTAHGHAVTIFEKGADYPYPHTAQFQEEILYDYRDPSYRLPRDLDYVTSSGDYEFPLWGERVLAVGGAASVWSGVTLRMIPSDFKTRTLYGYGDDWPITYDDLEPYYCQAERLLGVSGTDADNPFAPPRSQPYPLPPFAFSYDDRILSERLRAGGIHMHSTPQARTRQPYETRPECRNFGTCHVCPIGARYSPQYHLQRAVSTGLCTVRSNVSVRRIVTDQWGRARSIVCRSNSDDREEEYSAKIVVLAAGALESARLLLLSKCEHQPHGIGNDGGHVGAHLAFHHLWPDTLHFSQPLFPARVGAWTGQSHQFLDEPERGRHASVKVELTSRSSLEGFRVPAHVKTGAEVLERMRPLLKGREVTFHAESPTSPQKYVTLSAERDRFGDPFAHVHYQSSELDYATYTFASRLSRQIAEAAGADGSNLAAVSSYHSGMHHMGTCRMGTGVRDSVVDSFGRVHGTPNLFVAGSSIFCGPSGAVNPTLTIVALALRTADFVLEQMVSLP